MSISSLGNFYAAQPQPYRPQPPVWVTQPPVTTLGMYAATESDVDYPTPLPKKSSSKIDELVLKHSKPIELPEATIPLTRIANRLAKAGGIQQAFNIQIVNKPSYNAAAFSNGTVIFNLDTLKRAKSPEELAFVLAHELSHVQFEDAKARKKRYGLATTAALVLEEASTWLLQARSLLKGIFISIAAPAAAFQWFAFQERKDEARADVNAIHLLKRAGYTPMGYTTAFSNMKQDMGKASLWTEIQWKVFGEDHPALPTRQRSVEQAILNTPPSLNERPLMSPEEWQDLKLAATCIPTHTGKGLKLGD
ncbi:M48 family metallopeptidase [Vampirovibrio sp.]|uniref:M48 family metallopeptidase n=1 Tax=Vampirovibrio sp. TaxID=2717857 RepID=UPI003593410F